MGEQGKNKDKIKKDKNEKKMKRGKGDGAPPN